MSEGGQVTDTPKAVDLLQYALNHEKFVERAKRRDCVLPTH